MLEMKTVYNALDHVKTACETAAGIKIRTDCLYPSFDPVEVFVVGYAEGAIIHDGGGASKSAWIHGIDSTSDAKLEKSAKLFGCLAKQGQMTQQIEHLDWLWAAIAAVANASSHAAFTALGSARHEKSRAIIAKTETILKQAATDTKIKSQFALCGESGKEHKFDLSVETGTSLILIDAVSPHHASIASKYMAFSDTDARPDLYKFAVYDDELPQEDKALLANVADLVSFQKISETGGAYLLRP